MSIEIVFETHSWSEDNDLGNATGWLPGALSERGQELARELGARRRDDGISAVFSSDLRRAMQTAEIAFANMVMPILADWRLRECDYGALNGSPAAQVHADRSRYLTEPFPAGESWEQAVCRVGGFLRDLPSRWSGQRVLVIGHVATRWALDHFIDGISLAELSGADFAWREGWEYLLIDPPL
jgi:2,3-bisphosphoglycerate-dependent phosphoglycerate mutase